MRKLKESTVIASRVLGLLIGDNFTTPNEQVLVEYPYFLLSV